MTGVRLRRALLAASMGGILATSAFAEDAKPAAPPGPAKRKALDPKDRARIEPILRGYLDAESTDGFRFRLQLIGELRKLRETGYDLLADRDDLMSLVYASRWYHPAFEKKLLPKGQKNGDEIEIDPASNVANVIWGDRRLSVSMPTGYMDAVKNKKLAAMPPYPAIVTLHEASDFMDDKGQKKFPGAEVIRRLWDRKTNKLADSWFVFAPVATRAKFVEDGKVHLDRVPVRELWTRYNVDFDRIVLEGGADALAIACAWPSVFAGVIVRGGDAVKLPSADAVRNMASLAVYVVGGEETPVAKELLAAGFPQGNLTTGGADGLAEWLNGKAPRRVVPRSFRWIVKDAETQSLAYWINVEQVEAGVDGPTLKVDVVDTEKDPNTIQVTSYGVRALSMFLSDAVVDLDREVRVVVNGQPLKEVRIPSPKDPQGVPVKLPAKFERTVDSTFDLLPEIWPRRSQNYGFLNPVMFSKIPVRTDRKEGDTATTPAGGEPPGAEPEAPLPEDPALARAEKNARTYFAKAAEKEKAGDLEKALELYRKAVDEGDTTVKAKAAARVTALETKAGAGAGGGLLAR